MTPSRPPPDSRTRPSGAPDPPPEPEPATTRPRRATVLLDLAIMIGAFATAGIVAQLAGAANLGTALSFGQIAFALAAFYVVMRR